MNKPLSTVKSELTALMSGGSEFTAAQMLPYLINIVDSLESAVYLKSVTGYTGTDSLEEIATVNRSVGELICLKIDEAYVIFKLMAGTTATLSPVYIRPTDYNESTNAKFWQRADVVLVQVTNAMINEFKEYSWAHGTGIRYPQIQILDNNEVCVPFTTSASPAAGTVKVSFPDADTVTVKWNDSLTGTHKIIARF